MPDVLSQLPILEWRGLKAPAYDTVSFDYDHDLAARAIPYVNVDVHDDVRRKSSTYKARLYFCESVVPGSFAADWPKWAAAIADGGADNLVHPLLGTIRARVQHVGGEVKAQIRDGIVIDVAWIETNEDPSKSVINLVTQVDLGALAAEADAKVALVLPNIGGASTSLLGAFESIRGQLFSLGLTAAGALTSLIATVETMESEVGALNTHESVGAHDALITLWSALTAMQNSAAVKARSTGSRKLSADTTLDAFAPHVGNTLVEIMGLNLRALASPIVPRGSVLRYYTS